MSNGQPPPPPSLATPRLAAAVAAASVAAAVGGSMLSPDPSLFGAFWLSGGVLTASLIRTEPRQWPTVAAAAVAVETVLGVLLLGMSWPPALAAALAGAAGSAYGAYAYRRWLSGAPEGFTVRRVALLCCAVAPMGGLLAATLQSAAKAAGGDNFVETFIAQWLGEVLGVVLVVPATVSVIDPDAPSCRKSRSVAEAAGFVAALAVVLWLVFSSSATSLFARPYPLMPVLLWAALRFGPCGVVVASALHAGVAIWFGTRGSGPYAFDEHPAYQQSLVLGFYLVLTTATFLLVAAVIRDRLHDEKRLQESLRFADAMFDNSPMPIQVFDARGVSLRMNEAQRAFLGIPSRDYGVGVFNILTDPLMVANGTAEMFRRAYAGEVVTDAEQKLDFDRPENTWDVTRREAYFEMLLFPLLAETGRPEAVVAFARDVTARRAAEYKFQESLSFNEQILRMSPVTMYVYDVRTDRTRYLNDRRFGVPDDQGRTPPADAIHPDDHDRVRDSNAALESSADGRVEETEYRVRDADGRYRWLLDRRTVLERERSGAPRLILGMQLDIDTRKTAEETLRTSLAEKDTLLKEVHHRVKNNLSVVVGLLGLQSRKLADPAAREALQDCRHRVGSMAIVHEMLYQAGDFTGVDLPGYVDQLCATLRNSFAAADVRVTVCVEDLALDLDTAIPFGLIVTELLSNAFKHAFSGRPAVDAREVRLSVTRDDGGGARLTVADNGVGLPDDFDARQARSLGMRLVQNLARQIDGDFRADCAGGAVFAVRFPLVRKGDVPCVPPAS